MTEGPLVHIEPIDEEVLLNASLSADVARLRKFRRVVEDLRDNRFTHMTPQTLEPTRVTAFKGIETARRAIEERVTVEEGII